MTTREMAFLIWVILVVLVVFLYSKTRPSAISLLIAFLNVIKQPVFKIIMSYQLTVLLVIIIGRYNIIASWSDIKDYSQVVITIIIPFLIKAKIESFWNSLIGSIGIGSLFDFLISNFTFPLYIEMILLPIIVFLLIIISLAGLKELGNLKSLADNILNFIGLVIIIYVGIQILRNIDSITKFDFWKDYLVEPFSWIVNVPLILISVPMLQYDTIDNFRRKKKSVFSILLHTTLFLVCMFFHSWILLANLQKFVINVTQGGVGRRNIRVYVSPKTSEKKVKYVQDLYKYMLAPPKRYYDNKKIIPFRVECRDAVTFKLKIPIYEIHDLADDYKVDEYLEE